MPVLVKFTNTTTCPEQGFLIPDATPKNDGVMTAAQARKLATLTPGGGLTIESDGSALPDEGTLNFTSGLRAVNNGGQLRNDVSLTDSGVTAGTYGDADHVAQIAVDAKGRITSASEVSIRGAKNAGVVTFQAAGATSAVIVFDAPMAAADFVVSLTSAVADGSAPQAFYDPTSKTINGFTFFVQSDFDGEVSWVVFEKTQ